MELLQDENYNKLTFQIKKNLKSNKLFLGKQAPKQTSSVVFSLLKVIFRLLLKNGILLNLFVPSRKNQTQLK